MTVRGRAVCQRVFSGGAYVKRMKKAAARRAELCGVDLEGMWQLAIRRARLPHKRAMSEAFFPTLICYALLAVATILAIATMHKATGLAHVHAELNRLG